MGLMGRVAGGRGWLVFLSGIKVGLGKQRAFGVGYYLCSSYLTGSGDFPREGFALLLFLVVQQSRCLLYM